MSCCPDPTFDRSLQRLAKNMLGKEASNKGVPSTIRVNNIFLGESLNGELDNVAMLDRHDRVCSLGDDHESACASILLWQHRYLSGNLTNISDSQIVHLLIQHLEIIF